MSKKKASAEVIVEAPAVNEKREIPAAYAPVGQYAGFPVVVNGQTYPPGSLRLITFAGRRKPVRKYHGVYRFAKDVSPVPDAKRFMSLPGLHDNTPKRSPVRVSDVAVPPMAAKPKEKE